MSKKDFELIARVIADTRCRDLMDADALVQNMANALTWTNPKFNRDKFVEACK